MEIPFFDLTRQMGNLSSELEKVSEDVFRSGHFVSGPFTQRFEEEFSKYLKAQHCVSCGNATDGLELVLRALGVGPGDEVVVPSFTWISDAEAVSLVGARPVFVETDLETMNISVNHLDEAINPRTRAIIFTHLFGNTAGFKEVEKVARKFQISLIEDCAQAHGAEIDGQKVGTIGKAGVFSFYPTKNLGAYGDGGAVVSNDSDLASKIRLLANHGQLRRDNHLIEGRNSKLDELQAAYLLVKLKYLDGWNQRRTEIAKQYDRALGTEFITPATSVSGRIFHQYVIRTEDREEVRNRLNENGVGSAVHYPNPLPFLKPYFIPSYGSRFGMSRKLADSVLSLPIWPELRNEEVDFIIETLIGSATGE